ncbi:hypothetical protein FB460_0371 [Propioniferax innocua]|uniref:Uncharacterized protein n=1 Tax=Propioniferax innocua TaxID=1753 RepID=A0A542ZQH6_9ACTN|nr:hypothetical protein FB460_0371 [Propioniferax innocua]
MQGPDHLVGALHLLLVVPWLDCRIWGALVGQFCVGSRVRQMELMQYRRSVGV